MELHRERGSSWNYIAQGNHHGKASLWKKKSTWDFIAEEDSSQNFVAEEDYRGTLL